MISSRNNVSGIAVIFCFTDTVLNPDILLASADELHGTFSFNPDFYLINNSLFYARKYHHKLLFNSVKQRHYLIILK